MKTFQVAMNFLALCLSFKMMAIAKSTSRRNMETPGEPGERTRTLQGGQCIGIAPSSCSQLFGYTTCSSCTTSRACVDLAEACQNACNIHPGCSCDVDLGTCSFGTDNEYRLVSRLASFCILCATFLIFGCSSHFPFVFLIPGARALQVNVLT
jgi:hypothetical protein